MKLFAHQQAILDKNPAKCLLVWDTGTGKSYGSIELAKKNCQRVLVIVPKALFEKWCRDMWNNCLPTTYTVVTKEQFRRDWKMYVTGGYDGVIVDEAHYFSGPKSLMTKALLAFMKATGIKYIWMLTATPYLSTPWNIYTLAKHLGFVWSYGRFDEEFFSRKQIYGRWIPVLKPGAEERVASYVQQIGDIVRLDEAADVPEQTFEEVEFEPNKKQLAAMKSIDDEEVNPVVKFTKHHQIENGVLKGNEFEASMTFPSAKTDFILEMCRSNKKVAVVCRYNQQIDMLAKELEGDKEMKKSIFIIRGDVKDRDSVVLNVETSNECIVLIQAQCSEGYELPSVPLMLFASLSFSYKDYKQMLGRILRINKLKKNVYMHLITTGDVDEAVFENIMNKQDFDIEIYAREKATSHSNKD